MRFNNGNSVSACPSFQVVSPCWIFAECGGTFLRSVHVYFESQCNSLPSNTSLPALLVFQVSFPPRLPNLAGPLALACASCVAEFL